jgi:hypothetical protein
MLAWAALLIGSPSNLALHGIRRTLRNATEREGVLRGFVLVRQPGAFTNRRASRPAGVRGAAAAPGRRRALRVPAESRSARLPYDCGQAFGLWGGV